MYFRNFVITSISPWKREKPFIWKHVNPLYQRMHYAKFGWNCPSGSGEDFWNSSMYFRNFVIISLKLKSLHPRMLFAKFRWNWSSGSGEEYEMWKVYDNNDDKNNNNNNDNDYGQRTNVTWAFVSGGLKQDCLTSQKHYTFHNSFVWAIIYKLSVIKLSWGSKSTWQLNDYNTAYMALESILYDNKLKFLIPCQYLTGGPRGVSGPLGLLGWVYREGGPRGGAFGGYVLWQGLG